MTKNYQTIFYLSSFYINMQKIMLNNHVAFEISWFKASQNLIDCKFFLNMPNLKFTNLLLRFLNLYLHVKNIVDSDFRDSCFENSAIWLTQSLFDLTELKIFLSTFISLQFISACKKSRWLSQLLLKYCCFKKPETWNPKIDSTNFCNWTQ